MLLLNWLQKSHLLCTFVPIDFATRYISSVPNIIADNSFRGTVAFINLDFDATSAQLQVESFSFLPACTAAPPAVIAASVKQLTLFQILNLYLQGYIFLGWIIWESPLILTIVVSKDPGLLLEYICPSPYQRVIET